MSYEVIKISIEHSFVFGILLRKHKNSPDQFCSNTSSDRVVDRTSVAPTFDYSDLHGRLDATNIPNKVMDSLLRWSQTTTAQLFEQPIES